MAAATPQQTCGICLEPDSQPLIPWHAHASCLPCSEAFLANRLDELQNSGALEALEHCALAPGCALRLTAATLPPALSPALRARLADAEAAATRMRAAIERAASAGFVGLTVERMDEISRWRVADERHNTVCPHCFTLTFRPDGCNHMTCTRCSTHYCFLCSTVLDSRGSMEPGSMVQHFPSGTFSPCRNPPAAAEAAAALGLVPPGSSSSGGGSGDGSPREVPLAMRAQAAQTFATRAVVARGQGVVADFVRVALWLWGAICAASVLEWLGWLQSPITTATAALLGAIPDALEPALPWLPYAVWLPAAATLSPLYALSRALLALAQATGSDALAIALGVAIAVPVYRDALRMQRRPWAEAARAWRTVRGRVLEGLRLWTHGLVQLLHGLFWTLACVLLLPLACVVAVVVGGVGLLAAVLPAALLGLGVVAVAAVVYAGPWALLAGVAQWGAAGAALSLRLTLPLLRSQALATGLATLFCLPSLVRLALMRLEVMLDMGVGGEGGTLVGRALLTMLYVALEICHAQRKGLDEMLGYTPLAALWGRVQG